MPLDGNNVKQQAELGVGTSFTRSSFIVPIPPGKTMVQITISEQDINKDFPIAHGVIGDARAVLRQLQEEVTRQVGPNGRRSETRVAAEVEENFDLVVNRIEEAAVVDPVDRSSGS